MKIKSMILICVMLCCFSTSQKAAPRTYPPNSKSNPLVPAFANVSYGEHERNKLDFWQAESETPTPVIMILHGGGWAAGSKTNVPRSSRFPNLRAILGEGVSIVAINYRLIGSIPRA